MKRALISVTNKDGVVDFAKGLVELGFEIVSTGGTMKVLQENGVSCIAIDDVTGFPEMLDGRVKTLHPMVHIVEIYLVMLKQLKNTAFIQLI